MTVRYINPYTDFGFKKLFGEEASKDLLIDFLNSILPKEGVECPRCHAPEIIKNGQDNTHPTGNDTSVECATAPSMTSPAPSFLVIISPCPFGCCASILWA